MKVVSWNVRGGPQSRAKALAHRLSGYDADIVMLTEVSSQSALLSRMQDAYPFKVVSTSADNRGVAILSKLPLERAAGLPNALASRCASATTSSLTFIALYGPSNWTQRNALSEFWTSALSHLSRHSHEDLLVSGDFNLGLSSHDNEIGLTRAWGECADPHYRRLCEIGYVDAWRAAAGDSAREFSYYPARRGEREPHGRRLDHAFASPSLAPRVMRCAFDHSTREYVDRRRDGDHSALVLEIL